MLTKSYISLITLLISMTMFLLTGCSGGGASTANGQGSISAKLVWNDSKTIAKSVASAPAGVATVRISISGAGMTTVQQDFPAADGSGTLIGVPAGRGLTVTATGLDASGAITHQGAVGNVSVQNGLTTDVGVITMQVRSSFTAAAGTYYGTLYNLDGSINDTFILIVDVAGNIIGNNAGTHNDTTIAGKLTALSATQFTMTGSVMPGNYTMQGTLDITTGNFTGGTVTGTNNYTWIASKSITPPTLVVTSAMISGKTFTHSNSLGNTGTITFKADGTFTSTGGVSSAAWSINSSGQLVLTASTETDTMSLTSVTATTMIFESVEVEVNSPVRNVTVTFTSSTSPPPITPPTLVVTSAMISGKSFQADSGYTITFHTDGTVTTSKNSNTNTWVLNADGTILLNYMDLTTNPPTPGWDKFTLIQDNSPVSLVISGLNISGTTYPNSTWAYYTPPVTPPSYSNSSFSSVWFTSQLGSGSPLYLISDGAGSLSDISAFNFATPPGSYSVNANGTYSMTLVQSNGSSFAFTGNLTSATAGTVSFSGSTGSLTKVADLAKCQGSYSGLLSGGAAVFANYTISFSVGSTGTISSFASNIPGATVVTNSRFFSLADGTAIFMIRTNATSDEYRQIKGLGTLVNGRFTGALELDSDAAGGTVTLTKQ